MAKTRERILGMEFKTSALGSFKCDDLSGTAVPGFTYKLFNGAGVEITLVANELTATTTQVDFMPTFDYMLTGGEFHNTGSISDLRAWFVIAPDIPAGMGGSVEAVQDINLKYVTVGTAMFNSKSSEVLEYNGGVGSNKIRLVLKHPVTSVQTLVMVLKFEELL